MALWRSTDADKESLIGHISGVSIPSAHEVAHAAVQLLSSRRRLNVLLLRGTLAFVIALVVFYLLLESSSEAEHVLQYIDPLIGTGPGGHVFAGGTLPFGMAKPVADLAGSENMAGFAWDKNPVNGFSSLHDSGSGGLSSMGNFPIFLLPSCPDIDGCRMDKKGRAQRYIPDSVSASPGYFGLALKSGVRAEMTSSERTALFRFSFEPQTTVRNAVLLMDGSDLPNSMGDRSLAIDAEQGRITAEGTFRPSFGQGVYRAYQCVDFRGSTLESFGAFNTSAFPGVRNTSDSKADSWYARSSTLR